MNHDSLVPLLYRARSALPPRTDIPALLGVSLRTFQRWLTRQSSPTNTHLTKLAKTLHPTDPTLAAALAEASGATLESLGLVAPRGASGPFVSVPLPRVVDAIVNAAAAAGDVPRANTRSALVAALDYMRDAALDVETVLGVLTPPPSPASTEPKRRVRIRPSTL